MPQAPLFDFASLLRALSPPAGTPTFGEGRRYADIGTQQGAPPLYQGVPVGAPSSPGGVPWATGAVPISYQSTLPPPAPPPPPYDPYAGYIAPPPPGEATGPGAGPGVEGPGTPGDTSMSGRQTLANAMSGTRVGVGPVGFNIPTTPEQALFTGARLAMSQAPVVGPLFSALFSAMGYHNAAQLANQTAAAFGQMSANPAVQAQRAGERSISGGTPDSEAPSVVSDPDVATGLGLAGLLSSEDLSPPAVPVALTEVAPPEAPTAPAPQANLTAQGGLTSPAGGLSNIDNPGAVASQAAGQNVVEGPPGGTPGTGVGAPGAPGSVSAGLTAGEVGVAGTAPGDSGDGGGGGAGGCFLATFALPTLPTRERERAKVFFRDFHRLYMRSNPSNGPALFQRYQVVARRIIEAIKAKGPDVERREQKYIYEKLIKPTGAHVEKKEIPEAVRNLTGVVTTLANRYNVPLPARSTSQVPSGRPKR